MSKNICPRILFLCIPVHTFNHINFLYSNKVYFVNLWIYFCEMWSQREIKQNKKKFVFMQFFVSILKKLDSWIFERWYLCVPNIRWLILKAVLILQVLISREQNEHHKFSKYSFLLDTFLKLNTTRLNKPLVFKIPVLWTLSMHLYFYHFFLF